MLTERERETTREVNYCRLELLSGDVIYPDSTKLWERINVENASNDYD